MKEWAPAREARSILADLFPDMLGFPRLGSVRGETGEFLAVTSIMDGTPTQLWYHNGVERSEATLIGTLDNRPTDMERLGDLCVITHASDDLCSVLTWGAGDAVSIVGTFPTLDSPGGVDLMELTNGNIACAVACRQDNGATIVEITPAGVVVQNLTVAGPIDCSSTNDVHWVRDGSMNLVMSCLSENSVYVLPSGL